MHAIIAMCAASKTRICDDLAVCVYQHRSGTRFPTTPWTSTHPGESAWAGVWDHWLEEGIPVTPKNTELEPMASEFKAEAPEYLRQGRPWRYAAGKGKAEDDGQRPLV